LDVLLRGPITFLGIGVFLVGSGNDGALLAASAVLLACSQFYSRGALVFLDLESRFLLVLGLQVFGRELWWQNRNFPSVCFQECLGVDLAAFLNLRRLDHFWSWHSRGYRLSHDLNRSFSCNSRSGSFDIDGSTKHSSVGHLAILGLIAARMRRNVVRLKLLGCCRWPGVSITVGMKDWLPKVSKHGRVRQLSGPKPEIVHLLLELGLLFRVEILQVFLEGLLHQLLRLLLLLLVHIFQVISRFLFTSELLFSYQMWLVVNFGPGILDFVLELLLFE